jgi:hypothetical protein
LLFAICYLLFAIRMEHARMKYLLTVRRAMLLATTCALLQHGGLVLAGEGAGLLNSAPVVGTRPAMNTLTPQPVATALQAASGTGSAGDTSGDAQGNVAEPGPVA